MCFLLIRHIRPHLGSPRCIKEGQKIHSSFLLGSQDDSGPKDNSKEVKKKPYFPKAIPVNCRNRESRREYWNGLKIGSDEIEADLYDDIQRHITEWSDNADNSREKGFIELVLKDARSGIVLP